MVVQAKSIIHTNPKLYELGCYATISTNPAAERILGLAWPDSSPVGRAGFWLGLCLSTGKKP